MRKRELDQLLETAVARAIGVSVPASINRPKLQKPTRKPLHRMPVRHDTHLHM